MNSGRGDNSTTALPSGEFLLRLLQRIPQNPPIESNGHNHHPPPQNPPIESNGHNPRPPPPIESNGHNPPPPPLIESNGHNHPPFAPHAYIHGYPTHPNSISVTSQNIGIYQNNIFDPNYSTTTKKVELKNSQNLNSEVSNRVLNGPEANFRNSPNLSRVGEGYTRTSNGSEHNYCNGYNRALNGFEADDQNSQNLSRFGEGYSRAVNVNKPVYQNSPNLSRSGEGYNRALNGYEAENRNFPNLSKVGGGYNRALYGYEADYGNSLNLSRVGEGNNRALYGYEANYGNSPNLSRVGEGNNRAFDKYQNFPISSKIGEGSNRASNGSESNFQNQGITSRTVIARQEVRQALPRSAKQQHNRKSGNNVAKKKSSSNGWGDRSVKHEDERKKSVVPGNMRNDGIVGSAIPSVSGSEVEASMSELHSEIGENREKQRKVDGRSLIQDDSDDENEQKLGSLEEEKDGSNDNNRKKNRDKDYRSDTRGQRTLSQGMRKSSRQIECRGDIDMINDPLLSIYDSLIPPEEEKMIQKQLLSWLENLVIKEWPEARLVVYGSCVNSFGVRNSDIDICLAMKDDDVNKSEVLLKLADILKAEKLENVQALTQTRVPIVKLMDPSTGISCDICINNVLAVVNSKLLRDYAKIDDRLRQLAFIVKHWAKSRRVNETYHGTLSSYAYVLMCIHFLQQCRPAILPCLQEMDTTYSVVAENVECAFFDQVDKLYGFGSRNTKSIGQLVWGFFRYWAYCHDYAHDVVSVRVGSIISKRAKDWTRRVGKDGTRTVGRDRHLICIEDPFEITHDLGRVVDKYSIKVLRKEFERAAEILQFDPNPCLTLFEPYVPS